MSSSPSSIAAARDLRVVFSRLRTRLREVGAADDLTPSQTSALIRLFKDGPASTSELAGAERVRQQSMAATLAGPDRHGFLRRSPDPTDGRRQLVALTPLGRRRAEDHRRARDEWFVDAMEDRYTEAERRVINEALTLLDRLTN